jgi:hypothetical protein
MKRVFILCLGVMLMSSATRAQNDWWFDSEEREREITGVDNRTLEEKSFKERLTLGGGAALQLGSATLIGASPQVGYRINNNLIAGIGATYYFQRFKQTFGNSDQYIIGGSAFARRRLLPKIFAHVELESVNQPAPFFIEPVQRDWTSLYWVGAGYYTGLTDRLGGGFTVLYDLSENPANPYDNPTFRGGVSLGF